MKAFTLSNIFEAMNIHGILERSLAIINQLCGYGNVSDPFHIFESGRFTKLE
jgi:hypothetical protein